MRVPISALPPATVFMLAFSGLARQAQPQPYVVPRSEAAHCAAIERAAAKRDRRAARNSEIDARNRR